MKWVVEREGFEIKTFDNAAEWERWMHTLGRRKNSECYGSAYDVAIDPDGNRWVQVGYVLLPEEEK